MIIPKGFIINNFLIDDEIIYQKAFFGNFASHPISSDTFLQQKKVAQNWIGPLRSKMLRSTKTKLKWRIKVDKKKSRVVSFHNFFLVYKKFLADLT